LLTGRNFGEFKQSQIVISEHQIRLDYKIDLPSHELDPQLEPLISRGSKTISIQLPSLIFQMKKNIRMVKFKSSRFRELVSKRLDYINKRNETHITIAKLNRYMGYWLNRTGADLVEVELLAGKLSIQNAGIYYYQTTDHKLSESYQLYIKNICKLLGVQTNQNIENRPIKNVGSQLKVHQNKILLLFESLSKRINILREKKAESLEELHNLYVIHCLFLLNITSGHRHVMDPYENVKTFDFTSNSLYISDKEVRSGLSARIIELPEISIQQVLSYLNHLKNARIYFLPSQPELADSVRQVITGEMPLFFFLKNNCIERVTPSTLTKELEDIFPLPLNWHRHYMRSYLRGKGICGQWVDAWMGHATFGSEAFSRFSGLDLGLLKEIAEIIGANIENDLNISCIEGLELSL
jgi:hypothetical protein